MNVTLRLAYNPVLRASGRGGGLLTDSPDIRLAFYPEGRRTLTESPVVPVVRLAHVPGAQGDNSLRGVERLPDASAPGLLVSFVYLRSFLGIRARCAMRDWVLDSGAYSAHNSGGGMDVVG